MIKKVSLYRDDKCGAVKWRVRWYGKYDPKKGKEKRYSKTFDLKRDAERFQKQKEREFDKGIPRDPSNDTLKAYATRWLSNKQKIDDLRPATVLLYELTLERLYSHFGPDHLIRKIDRQAAMTFLAELQRKNDSEKPLSNWSRHRVLRHCKTLFNDAVKDGKINQNPFKGISGPKCTPSEWYYLKPHEFERLLEATQNLRDRVLYALAYTAGLRESEALALYWADIDFDKGRVRIVNRPGTNEYPPFEIKDSDVRTVPLPKITLDMLAQLQLDSPENIPFVLMDEQGCERIRMKWQECRKKGAPWLNRYWSNNVVRDFHRRVRRAEIDTGGKELTVHVLRKCCGQNWSNTLPINVVKEFMGHGSIDTTEKFYSTVDDSHYEKATGAMNDLFDPESGNTETKESDHKVTISEKSGEDSSRD